MTQPWAPQGIYEQVSGGGTGVPPPAPPPNNAGSPAFVYRPGGVAAANVYTTQATLRTAVLAVAGCKWIEIDTTFAAATWTGVVDFLQDVTLTTNAPGTLLTFAAGATIANTLLFLTVAGGLVVTNTGTVVFTALAGTLANIYLRDAFSTIAGSAGAAFFSIPNGAELGFNIYDFAAFGDSTNAAVNVAVGGTFAADAFAGGQFNANAVAGGGTFNLAWTPDAAFYQPQGIAPPVNGYINPPPHAQAVNAGGLGPAASISQATTATPITQVKSGFVRVVGSLWASASIGTAAGAQVTFTLLRDVTTIATQKVGVDVALNVQCTMSFIDQLPAGFAAHTYTIKAAIGAGSLSAVAGAAIINADELT